MNTWMEQTLAWRHSEDLKTYNIYEKNGKIFVKDMIDNFILILV